MFISVLIPTYNKWKALDLTLLSLERQDYDYNKFEVVIVNDGSSDQTEEMVRSHQLNTSIQLKYFYQQNKGRSAARNTGIGNAQGDIIIFVDDDRLVAPDFVSQYARSYINTGTTDLVVIGKRRNLHIDQFEKNYQEIKYFMQNYPEKVFARALTEYYWVKLRSSLEMPKLRWVMFLTGNVAMGTSLFEKVGTFNENFTGWGFEDTELGFRLNKAGIPFVLNENAINYHIVHKQNRLYRQRNLELFYQLHQDPSILGFEDFFSGDVSLEGLNRRMMGLDIGDCEGETFFIDKKENSK